MEKKCLFCVLFSLFFRINSLFPSCGGSTPPAHSVLYFVSQKTSWAVHRSLQQKPSIGCILISFHQVVLKSNITRVFFFTLLFTVVTEIWKCGSDPTRCLITADKLNVGTKNVLPQAVKAQTLYINPHPTRHRSLV